MKFTVVTPARNALAKLPSCVGSVRGQRASVEHIVCDAESADGTQAWLQTQPDVSWVSESDSGMYDAINKGWRRGTGDILSWLNSDEQYLPGTLERVAKEFESDPSLDFVYGNHIVVSSSGQPVAARREIRLSHLYISNSALNAGSCTMFFRRRLFEEGVLALDTRYRYAADYDLVLRLLEMNCRWKHIQEYLSLFMFDGTNLSCEPDMIKEGRNVQLEHGGFRTALMRKVTVIGRIVEKIAAGSYIRRPLEYDFYVDSNRVFRIKANSVPASYRTR